MNRNIKKVFTAIVISILSITTLCGCKDITIPGIESGFTGNTGKIFDGNVTGSNGYSFDESFDYEIGGGEIAKSDASKIDSVAVDWIAGEIKIEYADDKKIKIEETGKINSDDEKLRYRVDGSTLRVYFCRSGYVPISLTKTVTITFPKNMKFNSVDVDTVSGGMVFEDIKADQFSFDGVSAGIEGHDLCVNQDVDVNTVSGAIKLSGLLSADNVIFDTTSGGLTAQDISVDSAFKMDSVSGSMKANLLKSFNIDFNTTSGNMLVTVPSDASFKVELDSVSGDFDVDIPVIIDEDAYVIGDGEYTIEVNSVSGGIEMVESK